MAFKKLMKKSKSVSDNTSQDLNPVIGYVVKSVSDLPKFHTAVWQEDFNKVSKMIKKSDINARDKEQRTPLHLASAKVNVQILKLLCHYSPDVNAQDRAGKTALFKAAEAASSNAVNILLQARANPSISSRDGDTPLHVSSQANDERSVKLLIDHGADLNTPNANGLTPLHIAAQAGHANLVELFAKEGAKLNVLCGESHTPLMAGAEHGRMQVVRTLLELRVETEVKNRQGWKAVDLAQIGGHNQCKILIEDEVKRRAPRQLPSLESQPGLFSDRSGFGAPAHDTASSKTSDLSEVSAQDMSEDDSISFEPSVHELERPKISLSGALQRPRLQPLSPPTDQTMSPNKQDLESDTDSSHSPSVSPARISPVHSSPELERVAEVCPLETSRTVGSVGGAQLSSTPIMKPVLLSDESDTGGSDASVSENNLYIPTFNPVSPLSDVPASAHPLPAVHPVQDISHASSAQQGNLVEGVEGGGENVSEGNISSQATPRHHILATSPLESTASAGMGGIQAGEKVTELEDSTSDFDSDQEVAPDRMVESGDLNNIYDILNSDSENLDQNLAPVTATSSFEIENFPKENIVPETLNRAVRSLPPIPPDSERSPSHSQEESTSSSDQIYVELDNEENVEPKPSSPFPLSDNTTIPLDFPEIQTPIPAVDNSSLQTVIKSVSKFESLTKIPGTDVPTPGNPFGTPVNPLGTSDNPRGTYDNPRGTPVNPLGTPGNPLGTSGNPLGTYDNPLGTPGNPRGTPVNPLGTPGNPLGTSDNPRGTYDNPRGTPGNPLGTYDNPRGTYDNPRGTPVNPLGTPGNPLGTSGNPLGTYDNPLGTPGNPRGTPVNPLGTPGNPLGTSDNPRGTYDNPRGTPGNPLGTYDNPRGTPDNPLGTSGNPLGTPGNPLGTDTPSHQFEFDSSLTSEGGNPELARSHEGIASDVSSSDEPPLTSHIPTLWHTTLSPNRLSAILPTQETALHGSQPGELSIPISLSTIPAVQLTDSKSLYTLTQQLSRVLAEKEGLEQKLRFAEINSAKMNRALEGLRTDCSELQQEKGRLVEAQQDSELLIRKLQLELQQKSSANLEESEMMKQLGEKVVRLETQLVGETEARTNEEVRRRELELQLQLSQTTGVQMSNRVNELCIQLSQCQNALGDMKHNYSQSSINYETLKKGHDTVVSQREGLQIEISKLESHVNTCNRDIEKVRTELSLVSEELRRKEGKVEDLQTAILQQSDQTSSLLQDKAESLRVAEKRASEDKMTLEVQLVNANAENSKLQGELLRSEDRLSVLEREVQRLNDRLRQASTEAEQLRESGSVSERASQNAASVTQAEKELLERENSSFREQTRALRTRVDSLEQQLVETSSELKHTQSLLSERGNLVTILQRDVDHNALLLASTADKLKSEEQGSVCLGKQLEQTSAALVAARQENSLANSQLEQSRYQLGEQRALSEKLESRYQAEARQAQSLVSESRASAEGDRQGLLQELASHREKASLLQEQLAVSQGKLRESQEEVSAGRGEYSLLMQALKQEQQSYRQLQDVSSHLQEERTNSVSEQASLQSSISILQLEKASLCKELESQQSCIQELTLKVKASVEEASAIVQARESLESQFMLAESEKLELLANHERQSQYIDALKNELTATRKERTGHDTVLFEMNDKKLRLEEELFVLREEKGRALMEASECKVLWETEVKSRSKLGIKVLQIEEGRDESERLLKSEREERARVSGGVSALENKIEQMTQANNRAEERNRTLGTELKSYKKRIKDFELREFRFPDIKAELSKERTAFENSLNSLRDQLTQSRETAATLKSDNTSVKAQLSTAVRDLDQARTLLTRLKSEKGEEGQAFLLLKVEQQKLREELSKSQHSCSQKEKLYLRTKEAEMHNRRGFNIRLQELNAHILEQTQAQDELDRSKREGELLLIQELEKKTSQLESELVLAKRGNLDEMWREDYNHTRYGSYAYKDNSTAREATKYKEPIQDIHGSYRANDMFSLPHSTLLPGDSLGSFLPTFEPAPNLHYHATSAPHARDARWLEVLDSKIADQLSFAESVNVSSAEPTILSRDNDPHLTAILHNYEV